MTGTTPIDTIICGDCLEEMKKLPANSIPEAAQRRISALPARLDRWVEA